MCIFHTKKLYVIKPKLENSAKISGIPTNKSLNARELICKVLHARKRCDMLIIDVVCRNVLSHLLYKIGITDGARNNSYLTYGFYSALKAPYALEETLMCAFIH